jgi:1-acyl-sn-glycerol-3-phosphate acyltransferase
MPVRVARVLALVLVLVAGVAVALSVPLLTSRGRARAVRGWFRWVLTASGVRLVVTGDRRRSLSGGGATLVTANHLSWLDIPAVLAVEPMRVLASRTFATGR